jgi:hypothetical protein
MAVALLLLAVIAFGVGVGLAAYKRAYEVALLSLGLFLVNLAALVPLLSR